MTIFMMTGVLSLSNVVSAQAYYIWLEAEDGIITGEGLEVNSNDFASDSGGKGLHVFKTDLTPTSVLCHLTLPRLENMTLKSSCF